MKAAIVNRHYADDNFNATIKPEKTSVIKLPVMLLLAVSIGACTPEKPAPQAAKVEVEKKEPAVVVVVPPPPQSTDQVKTIAKEYGVSEAKVHDTASRAAELSGGNASKQDMLDALKAATGK